MKFQSIPLPPREAPSEGAQPYSAIVYYDNPYVVARNSRGFLIDSGIAYEDDEKVIQSAIDSLSEGLVLVKGVDPTTVSVTEKDKVKVAFYYQGIPRYTSVHTENVNNTTYSVQPGEDIQAVIDSITPLEAEKIAIDLNGENHSVSAPIEIKSGICLQNGKLILEDGANDCVVKTKDFDSLTGSNSWYVDTEGVPYWFELKNIVIDGNKANQTSSSTTSTDDLEIGGLAIYGKNYILDNVVINNCYGRAFYTECGFKGSRHDWRDLPEGSIKSLQVIDSDYGCLIRGPHDNVIHKLISASHTNYGIKTETSSDVYSADGTDIRFTHVYTCDGNGLETNNLVRVGTVVVDGCDKGLVLNYRTMVSLARVWKQTTVSVEFNDPNSQIETLFCMSTGGDCIHFNDNDCTVMDATMDGNSNSVSAVVIDGNGCRFEGTIKNFNGGTGVGIVIGDTGAVSNCHIDAYLAACDTYIDYKNQGFNNTVNATGYTYTGETILATNNPDDRDDFNLKFEGSVSGFSPYKGNVLLSSGNTVVSVTHNAPRTPEPADILVTPTTSLGSASFYWVDNLTSTTFDINVDADPTQDVYFNWWLKL